MKTSGKIRIVINAIIAVLVLFGCYLSFTGRDGDTLAARGAASLKFFTVDSNILVGIASLVFAIYAYKGQNSRNISLFKFTSTVSVGITFLTVAAFLGPLYGYSNMYHRANFWFHLIIPVIAILEFLIFTDIRISAAECLWCIVPILIYGIIYIINILLMGTEKGDWYGFTNWGFPIGIGIFTAIMLSAYFLGLLFSLASVRRVARKNCRLIPRDVRELILLAIDYPITKKTARDMCSGRDPVAPGTQIYGIRDDAGRMMAMMTATFNYVFPHDDGKSGRVVHISGAFSHRNARGRGYATRLIGAIENDARRHFKADYLCCDSTANELYAGSGFVHAPEDETRMWKPLS